MEDNKMGKKIDWHKVRAWLVGLILLSGLIFIVSRFSELAQFTRLLRQAEPVWLILVLLLQTATYISVAAVWYMALRKEGLPCSIISLIPVSVAKLFSDQVMPSGGVGGTVFFIAALKRRAVPARICMDTLLFSLVAYYGAYLLSVVLAVLLLWYYQALHIWIIIVAVVFCFVAVGTPAVVLWLRRLEKKHVPPLLMKFSGIEHLMDEIEDAEIGLLRSPVLIITAILLHGTVFLLDAATLWVMLRMVGAHVSFWIAFPSFVIASIVVTVSPIPLGLGTFEVSCVSMLRMLGVPIEAALTATLLLRGFTLWVPMLPGMWLVKRILHDR